MIEQSLEELTGLNIHIIEHMADSGLLELCDTVHGMDCDKLILLAELFSLEGDVLAAQNKSSESRQSYQRALYLYENYSTACSEKSGGEIQAKMQELEKKIH